ncbi:MAG: NUDIX domain-containing protein [bacterium]
MKQVNNTKPKDLHFAVLATDVVVFTISDGELKVLLTEINLPPHYVNTFGIPGGLILPNETAEDSVLRHIQNKIGIKVDYIEQLYTFSSVDRDPRGRVVSVAYFALVPGSSIDKNTLIEKISLRSIKKIPQLAYDHNQMIEKGIERLKAKLGYTTIIRYLLPTKFTLSELQSAYEIIFGKSYDKRNFRKKILELGILKNTNIQKRDGAHRPADLYSFSADFNKIFEIL